MSTPAAPAATASDHLPAGTTVGERYTLTGHIGRGGVGDVYRATDPDGREVAVKVLDLKRLNFPPDERERLLRRFEREASAAARIAHPNVITIHASGVDETLGCPYMAMELLKGHDLQMELHTHRTLKPSRAIALTRTALDALAAAHALGVVHKDLKPANLFLSAPGTANEKLHLLDFGVAHIVKDERLTQAGKVACTPNYAAPEYVMHHDVSPSYDVYQVGLILVEMFTGRPVVNLGSAGLCLAAHASGKLELPTALLDGPLRPLLTRSLALAPADRYPDAAAMKAALDALDLTHLKPVPPGNPTRQLGTPATDAPTRPALANEQEQLLRDVSGALDSIVVDDVAATDAPTRVAEAVIDPTATVQLSDQRSQRLKSILEDERRVARTTTAQPTVGTPLPAPEAPPQRESTPIEAGVIRAGTSTSAPHLPAAEAESPHQAPQPISGGPMWLLVTALIGLVLLGSYPCMSVAALALVRSVEARVDAPEDEDSNKEDDDEKPRKGGKGGR